MLRAETVVVAAIAAACWGVAHSLPKTGGLQVPDGEFRDAFQEEVRIYPGQQLTVVVSGDIDIRHRYYEVTRRSGLFGLGRTTDLREDAAWRSPAQHGVDVELTQAEGSTKWHRESGTSDNGVHVAFTPSGRTQIITITSDLESSEERSVASLTQYQTVRFRINPDNVARTKCESQRVGTCSKGTYVLQLSADVSRRVRRIGDLLSGYVDPANIARPDLIDETTLSDRKAVNDLANVLVAHALARHADVDDRIIVLERARAVAPTHIAAGMRLTEAYVEARRYVEAERGLRERLSDAKQGAESPDAGPVEVLTYEAYLKQALVVAAERSVFDVPGDLQRATQSGLARLGLLGDAMRTKPYDLQYSVGYGEAALEVAGLHALFRTQNLLEDGTAVLSNAVHRLPYRYPGELIGTSPSGERIAIASYARQLRETGGSSLVDIAMLPRIGANVVATARSPSRLMYVLGDSPRLEDISLWTPSAPQVAPLKLFAPTLDAEAACDPEATLIATPHASFPIGNSGGGDNDWPLLFLTSANGNVFSLDSLRRICRPLAAEIAADTVSNDGSQKLARPTPEQAVVNIAARSDVREPLASVLYTFPADGPLRKARRSIAEAEEGEMDASSEFRLALWTDLSLLRTAEDGGGEEFADMLAETADEQSRNFVGIDIDAEELSKHRFIAIAEREPVRLASAEKYFSQRDATGRADPCGSDSATPFARQPTCSEYTLDASYDVLSRHDNQRYCVSQLRIKALKVVPDVGSPSYSESGTFRPCVCEIASADRAQLVSVPGDGASEASNFVVIGSLAETPTIFRSGPATSSARMCGAVLFGDEPLGETASGYPRLAQTFPRVAGWHVSATNGKLQLSVVRTPRGSPLPIEQRSTAPLTANSVVATYTVSPQPANPTEGEVARLLDAFPTGDEQTAYIAHNGTRLVALVDSVTGWIRILDKATQEVELAPYDQERLVRAAAVVLERTGVTVLPVRTPRGESAIKLVGQGGRRPDDVTLSLLVPGTSRLRVSQDDQDFEWIAVGRADGDGDPMSDDFAIVGLDASSGHVRRIRLFEVRESDQLVLREKGEVRLPDSSQWIWVSAGLSSDVPFVHRLTIARADGEQDYKRIVSSSEGADEQWSAQLNNAIAVAKSNPAYVTVKSHDWTVGSTWSDNRQATLPGATVRLIAGTEPAAGSSAAILDYGGGLVLTSTHSPSTIRPLSRPTARFEDSVSMSFDNRRVVVRAYQKESQLSTYHVMGERTGFPLDEKHVHTAYRMTGAEWNGTLLSDRSNITLHPEGKAIVFDAGGCTIFAEVVSGSTPGLRGVRDFPLGAVGGIPSAISLSPVDAIVQIDDLPTLALDTANLISETSRSGDLGLLNRLDSGMSTQQWLGGTSPATDSDGPNSSAFCSMWPEWLLRAQSEAPPAAQP